MNAPVPDYGASLGGELRGLRIGVPKEYFVEGTQREVEAAVREALNTMAALGAEIVEVSLPHTSYALPVYYLVAPAEASANLARYDGMRYGLSLEGADLWDTYRKTRGPGLWPRGQAAGDAGNLCPVGGVL